MKSARRGEGDTLGGVKGGRARWGGGPSLPPRLVSLGTSPTFPFFSVWAGGGSWGGRDRRPGRMGFPAPHDPPTLEEGVKGGQWGGGERGSHRFSSAVAWPCLSFPSPLHSPWAAGGRAEVPGDPAGWENLLPEPPPPPAALRRAPTGLGLSGGRSRVSNTCPGPAPTPRTAPPGLHRAALPGIEGHCTVRPGTG